MRYNGNMEVCTLTLNPCLDRTLWVEDFGLPPTHEEWQTGGKGVNVARVLAALGFDVGGGIRSMDCDTLTSDPSRLENADCLLVIRLSLQAEALPPSDSGAL